MKRRPLGVAGGLTVAGAAGAYVPLRYTASAAQAASVEDAPIYLAKVGSVLPAVPERPPFRHLQPVCCERRPRSGKGQL